MNRCNQKYLLIDYVFNELTLDQKKQLKRHLDGCQDCQKYLTAVATTFNTIKNLKREKPGPGSLHNYHLKLKQAFGTEKIAGPRIEKLVQSFIQKPSIPARIAEAFILLLIGFFIGQTRLLKVDYPIPATFLEHEIYHSAIEPGLLKNYLQETEMILLDVANLDPTEDLKIIIHLIQSAKINYLLQKTILIREQAKKLNDDRLAGLLNQIELILLDLSNFKKNELAETISEIKEQMKVSHLLIEIKSIKQEKL